MPETAAINEANGNYPPRIGSFGRAAAVLTLLFAVPLYHLARFAAPSELHSYILLMPAVYIYLGWLEKKNLQVITTPAMRTGLVFLAAGLAMTVWHLCAPAKAGADSLAQITLAYVLLLAAAGFMILGGGLMRQLAFPFGLSIFLVPMPDALRDGVETALQHGSAMVAGWMFAVSDVPVFQSDLIFQLPSITLQVAPECSGIHSSMVLFITSLVAGKFFLQQPWKRAVLCLAVIPLAIVRNGFRVFVLGELCTHIGPQMIDSPIHHHGGPLFFVLSLVPFMLLLYVLRKYWRPVPGPVED